MNDLPIATRPLEYVGFLKMDVRTGEGLAHIFAAVDVYMDYAFNLGIETNDTDETILKKIYQLTEDSEFVKYRDQGFTLVFEEFEHLSDRIQSMIGTFNGQVMFNKRFNNTITLHFMETMAVFMKNESDAGLN